MQNAHSPRNPDICLWQGSRGVHFLSSKIPLYALLSRESRGIAAENSPTFFIHDFISQKVFIQSFCTSQSPLKFVVVSSNSSNIKNKLTNLYRN